MSNGNSVENYSEEDENVYNSHKNGVEDTDDSDDKPVVELFLKVSPIGKEDKGPCPISQQWFMVFYLLAEKKILNLFVTTVNLDLPPEGYLALDVGRHLPVARVISGSDPKGGNLQDLICDTNDEIEQLMDMWKCPNLALPRESVDEGEAEKCFADLYKDLNLLLKTGNVNPLQNVLRKINSFLASRGHRYLLADELTYADCQLMPKLHHTRLAAKAYCNFNISPDLTHLMSYMEAMYETPAFRDSAPADRDILHLYYDKLPADQQPSLSVKPTLMGSERSLSLHTNGVTNGDS